MNYESYSPFSVNSLLSIVIPALNSVETIDSCLRSIFRHLPAGAFEVFVADNGSTDGTVDVAESHSVRLVHVPRRYHVSRVRNEGAKIANGSLLAFLDSDCEIGARWYDTIVGLLTRSDVGIVGNKCGVPRDTPWVERIWQSAYIEPQTEDCRSVEYVPAANMAITKALFDQLGGFDETLETGEDPDLCKRVQALGLDVVEHRHMDCVHLGNPKNLLEFYRREAWHGRGVRLRYATGQISATVVASIVFALSLVGSVAFSTYGLVIGKPAYLLFWVVPLLIPAGYVVLRRRSCRIRDLPGLFLIYCAYFLGRGRALTTAASSMLGFARKT